MSRMHTGCAASQDRQEHQQHYLEAAWLCTMLLCIQQANTQQRHSEASPKRNVNGKLKAHSHNESTSTCSETMTDRESTMKSATSLRHTVCRHVRQTVSLHTQVLQDEMNELVEREEQEAVTEKEAAEAAAHLVLMQEANLEVVLTCWGLEAPGSLQLLHWRSLQCWGGRMTSLPFPRQPCNVASSSVLWLSFHSSEDSGSVGWHNESSACQQQAPAAAALQPFSSTADTPSCTGPSQGRELLQPPHHSGARRGAWLRPVVPMTLPCQHKAACWHAHSAQVPAGCGDDAG